ncbi:PrsW family intramembrane metalloprotease [Nocardioides convexus]|uniref:PrsW family intramembrane metalloprotease n=1 Tax=Nocardioides convexus TaxID=2712224 RepID=UPI0024182CD7|nr:PrsW family intramembrane metalloprotease [Nocardioides convexus]
MTVAVTVGALLTLVLLALSGAPGTTVLAVGLAAVPVGPVLAAYLWLDRYEPEPRPLLVAGLGWGAFVATMAALVIQGIGGLVVPVTDNTSLAIVAPVVEEASKGLFLVLLLWWRRAEVDGILDGIVYAGMVGVGFAFTENVLYLIAAYNGTDGVGPGGLEAVTGTFVLRCLFSPFAHPLFTAFTGIGIGIAVDSRSRSVRWIAPLGGYLLAVLAHGIWNGSTVFGFGSLRRRVRRHHGAGLHRHGRTGLVGARDRGARAADGAHRRRRPRPAPGDRHRLGGGPAGPPHGPQARPPAGRPGGGARHARLPAGGHRAPATCTTGCCAAPLRVTGRRVDRTSSVASRRPGLGSRSPDRWYPSDDPRTPIAAQRRPHQQPNADRGRPAARIPQGGTAAARPARRRRAAGRARPRHRADSRTT